MAGDHKVGQDFDLFSLTFPLPYRVGFILILGVWGWGVNLQYLERAKINTPSLIQYPSRSSPTQPPHHLSTYRLATVLSILFAFSLTTFWLFTRGVPDLVVRYDWMPMTFLAALAALFFAPLRDLARNGRRRLLTSLRRVSIGGIAEANDGKFGDILLADALTSYGKVLGDLFVAVCMFFSPSASATAAPNRSCGGLLAVPLVVAIPSAIRLRQCLIEYLRVKRAPYRESSGWGGQHLANAAKYATTFPVLVLATLQRHRSLAAGGPPPSPALDAAWAAAALLNSLYSLWWDVTKDWDLTLFSPARRGGTSLREQHPYGLRGRLAFRQPVVYYAVIALDLVLRCTWATRLSGRLAPLNDREGFLFLLQLLEVFRRWVWIFFRVEAEFIRNSSSAGLGVDDILLGDYKEDSEDDDL
ncbi:EXS family protein [Sodiomyces alkalinus F11]|uniref:EXS family protein n=1 Tax=Sodiomyces alkalinus (strain CBS 110278 / VKM F-3762 / F11) TaxID=1314773 RepID=A0A3N2PQU8_SODAK|nr:EXS family protein [Sodiomyces alkalinus F11]ROT36887.1 EXS family protein [Sodiomyces alkalinus F11]